MRSKTRFRLSLLTSPPSIRLRNVSIILLSLTALVSAQREGISGAKYVQELSRAQERLGQSAHRIKIEEEWSLGGETTNLSRVFEYDRKGNYRLVRFETRHGRTNRLDVVEHGDRIYCRINNGDWERSKTICIPRREMSSVKNRVSKASVDTVQTDGVKSRHFQETATLELKRFGESDFQPVIIIREFWTDEDGRLLRSASRTITSQTQRVIGQMSETVEFDESIRIVPPLD